MVVVALQKTGGLGRVFLGRVSKNAAQKCLMPRGGGVVILSPANKKVLKSMHGGNGLRNEKVTIYHNPLVPSP